MTAKSEKPRQDVYQPYRTFMEKQKRKVLRRNGDGFGKTMLADIFFLNLHEDSMLMSQTEHSSTLDKRNLYHGTDSVNAIRGICTNNFDFRLSGKNATRHGDGAYFASDAKYSHLYTNPPMRYMFQAVVLVGSYTQERKSRITLVFQSETVGKIQNGCM
ncbi:PAR12-like protein [Mya arenaria]|uniref:Poly [ADP-ribose] polymerase n=1 Tax=Mya arenaria TaxID=6604 RepID=A0ABY7E6V8_MYAAR|nr:PAR12-like protein [Mya arenaria]